MREREERQRERERERERDERPRDRQEERMRLERMQERERDREREGVEEVKSGLPDLRASSVMSRLCLISPSSASTEPEKMAHSSTAFRSPIVLAAPHHRLINATTTMMTTTTTRNQSFIAVPRERGPEGDGRGKRGSTEFHGRIERLLGLAPLADAGVVQPADLCISMREQPSRAT